MPLALRRKRTAPRKRLDFLPGELVLRMKEDIPGLTGGVITGSAASLPAAVAAPLEYLRKSAGMKKITALFAEAEAWAGATGGAASIGLSGSAGDGAGLSGYHLCRLDPKKTAAALKKLRSDRAVELVERMPARFISGAGAAAAGAADPRTNLQWGLRAIKWFEAARPAAGGVRVAVVDSGVDAKHPDLAPMLEAYHHKPFSTTDVLGHGSHVMGIIAAAINNGVGITGVADCGVEMWKVFSDKPAEDGEFYADSTAYLRALREVITAAGRGVKVLNLSLTGEEISQVERTLLKRLEAAGVTVVASMGNEFEEGNPVYFPAASPEVVAVGAVDQMLRRGVFSCTGKHIALVAPGVSVLSTLPFKKSVARDESDTQYAAWDGTSMAAPHVAGAAALYYAKHPGATPAEVKQALLATAARVPKMGGKAFTKEYGRGVLDLPALLK